ncbi:DUF4185 domain-containing protein [Mycolicibacterium fluoranthenivorans]|uniref:DUF4185 domain-containing protein n=1 Tax=Mycolicibacterium fluoranthenivorans TaxID=258505 RepID=A0A7X5U3N4_9MYCO|nr:DUF4185 domain-containing protein [Mycolicibacterium fluoranthenivorans]MCV7356271.1 DUF4185 domain-containing protein [Mycolicibacterium fluoranthenivorans]NIH97807.1 hypothetical protein [Mycolicibacterium fluoranthenivorans]
MGAAAYIGRIGGLAMALGVGTAIATGHGIAAADDTSTAGTQTATSDTKTADKTDPKTGTDPKTAETTESTETEPAGSKGTEPAGSKDTDLKTGTTTQPADGVVVSAQTNTGSSTATKTPEKTAEPEKPAKPKKTARAAATTTTKTAKTATATAPADPAPSETKAAATTSAVSSTVQPAASVAVFANALTMASQTAAPTTTAPVPVPAVLRKPVTAVLKAVAGALDWALNNTANSPVQPVLSWTLLAFARREVDHLLTAINPRSAAATGGVAADTSSLALAATAVNPRPGFPYPGQQLSPSTSFVDWVTGNFAPNDTYNRFGIWGTDVGTMWDNGIPDDPTTPINEHQVLIAFGDTFGGPNMTGTWRLNTLFRSSDTNLSDGMTIPAGQWLNGNMFGGSPLWGETYARQIILPERLPSGLPTGVTLIPTAGISVPTPGTKYGATQYLSFMSVKHWGAAGQWTTNYSAIAYSEDNGENWYISPKSVRTNFGGNAKFQQAALIRPGDGYVYSYGTPNGRQGSAYVSRVAEKDILDASKYEFYSKGSKGGIFGIGAYKAGWYKNDPSKATPVFGQEKGACGIGKPGNQVSEMSVQYNQTLGKYVVLHADQFNNIILRTSDSPEGTWSAPTVLMTQQNGGIYAPMLHPWSPSTAGTGTDLYWNLSLWSQYNVMLMKTDLTKL